MNHVDLFSGIGGFALAARWAGFQTVLFCEIDKGCHRVLSRHWPGVPIHHDIRSLDRDALASHQIGKVMLLTGGFPCQPFSSAGKRRGKEDDRHLWPEMLRVIRECRPAWVVGENVAGFVRLALDDTLADLEAEGYACRAFLVAYANEEGSSAAIGGRQEHQPDDWSRSFAVAGTVAGGRKRQGWRTEPGVPRVAHGLPDRMDRQHQLGNAVVPQQVYPILAGIAALQREAVAP